MNESQRAPTTRHESIRRGVAVCVVAALAAGGMPVAAARAQGARSETLLYASYKGEETADKVFQTMVSAQGATGERIEAFAVVSKDLKGRVRVRDQRRRDAGVGLAVGGVIGLLGGPAGVAIGAGAGGAIGFLTGNAVGIPLEKVQSMKTALTPGTSALVVVLDDRWVQDVERDLRQAQARQVIASQIQSQ